MVIYIGQFSGNSKARRLLDYGWGRMWTTYITLNDVGENEPLGFDCGAYTAWDKCTPMHWRDFPENMFTRRLAALPRVPDIAVAPDLPMGGNDSLDFSVHWRKQLPDHLPWYLAVQDGVSESFVGANIENFSGLFMGGSTDFKRQAGKWCDIAHHHGKLFHYGRASTYKRVREARLIGADSIDSVSPVLRCADDPTKVNTKRALTRWIDEALNTNPQGELFQ